MTYDVRVTYREGGNRAAPALQTLLFSGVTASSPRVAMARAMRAAAMRPDVREDWIVGARAMEQL